MDKNSKFSQNSRIYTKFQNVDQISECCLNLRILTDFLNVVSGRLFKTSKRLVKGTSHLVDRSGKVLERSQRKPENIAAGDCKIDLTMQSFVSTSIAHSI